MIERAVVLGSGLAGLTAARVLADHAGQVTVLERDRVPDRPVPRAGVPQSRHVHALLVRGLRELERLFPGLSAELVAAGAVELDWTTQRLCSVRGWGPRYASGLVGVFATRGLVEHTVRRRVLGLPQVAVVEAAVATGLTGRHGRVTGVTWRERGGAPGKPARRLAADLVLDATGRGSSAPQWLSALGHEVPKETVVASTLGYASRLYEIPEDLATDWRCMVSRNPLPSTRAAVLYPVEGGRWVVTLAGVGADAPPHDEAGFRAYQQVLVGDVGPVLAQARPLGHIAAYRRTQNRWRQWEAVPDWPDGFLVLGDAVCCFNPVYGQGMTVAALEAALLGRVLAERGWQHGSAGQVQRLLAGTLKSPWALATLEDFRYPGTQGRRSASTRLTHWYTDQVLRAAVRDVVVHRRFMEVAHLLRPAASLAEPAILRRVLTR